MCQQSSVEGTAWELSDRILELSAVVGNAKATDFLLGMRRAKVELTGRVLVGKVGKVRW